MSALLALGGNLVNGGNSPAQTVRLALQDIEKAGFVIEKHSRFFQTPAFPAGSGPDYVNAAIQIRTLRHMSPDALLSALAQIELNHGRQRAQRWGGRTLDIDLLAMGAQIVPDLPTYTHWAELDPAQQAIAAPSQLIVPHPRLHERAFVLVPLMDVAPDWLHPVWHKTVRQMIQDLPKSAVDGVVVLTD